MGWSITIDNPVLGQYDISDRVLNIKTSENLDNKSDTFTVECKNISEVHKYAKIDVLKDGVKKYSGYILNQQDSDQGYKNTTFECVDWSDILHNRIIAKTYTNDDSFQGKPDLILKDILTLKVPEVTTINIRECSTIIDRIYFPYDSVMKALDRILEFIPEWHWYIDANKDFHFFKDYETDGPNIDSSKILHRTLRVQYIGENPANRVWIIGAKQSSPNYIEEYFTGDGVQRVFKLAYEPNFTEIYVDGVLKNSKLESNDDGNQDFLINKGEKVFYIPDNVATPFTGTIKARYRPTIQVIDYFENYNNIQTYGLFEKAIKNKDITDKASARQFGKAEIKKRTEDKRIISFSTTEESIAIGQRCDVNIVTNEWNVVGKFLVKSISRDIRPYNLRTNNPVPVISSVVMEELI
ncbi:hypothetical protein [Caloranaerobacter ferrireducens]|uniref:hypothetical protein n=1 Tax=Caloranaerobacter ferrireducens TaxID=1323370 RepID=UPI00084E06F6|nr:hypothetical protein [Caloranaerobacter ferrireducens]